ncbi:variable surface protein [Plasmodium gonderi]|uniref:Variable surface protein n=1 Tax=Plasmodium gonderi TaxID=77519 RepID=A0A1Y1JNX1_PLAGO|nr:variable surface protein [Plasmodium gonderi]GAW84171.1 variable surface protein [Plasmodium gonderi]
MDNDIFKFAKDFPKLWSIMENPIHTREGVNTGNCDTIEIDKFPVFNSSVKEICEKVENYGETVKKKRSEYNFTESHCIYLYYWLYYKNGKKYMSEVKSLYQELITSVDLNYCSGYIGRDYNTPTDNEMSKLNDLNDMYTKLNNSCNNNCECLQKCSEIYGTHVQTCKYHRDAYFCKELLKIKKQYDDKMRSNVCGSETPKILPSFQNHNITTLTLIPIFVILAISSFLFICYKFTPYSPRFLCRAMKIRRQYNNIDEEMNIQELSLAPNSDFRNNKYHILYNSH